LPSFLDDDVAHFEATQPTRMTSVLHDPGPNSTAQREVHCFGQPMAPNASTRASESPGGALTPGQIHDDQAQGEPDAALA